MWPVVCASLVVYLFLSGQALAIEANNVLVLYNADDGAAGTGFQIASHYAQSRPGVHLLGLTGINSILSGAFNEEVSAGDYLSVIRPQVLNEIGSIADSIDVIVTIKGLPLRVDAGPWQSGSPVSSSDWERYSSLESELTRVDSMTTVDQMGNQSLIAFVPPFSFIPTPSVNPYYSQNAPFTHAGSDPLYTDIRLAARLDGYSVQTVNDAIDRARQVFITRDAHYVVIDDDPTAGSDQMVNGTGPGPGLQSVVTTAGQANTYENTNTASIAAPALVIGYESHGTNDGGLGLDPGYILNQLQFQLADGAVFHTHESFNARSFDPSQNQSQGLVAEWLEIGGTAGLGHVREPFNGHINVTNEDLFYQMLLPAAGAAVGESGLTFVEAAWNATAQLSYVNTVIGDPLMRWTLALPGLPGDTNGDGIVDFNDFFTVEGNWLQSGTLADGDFTGDGMIDQADFLILQNNWLATGVQAALSAAIGAGEIVVLPVLDSQTGWPQLSATLMRPANLDQDLDVDGDDLALLIASYGVDSGGDVDGDGDTDGADFLLWQEQFVLYTLTADFDIDAQVGQSDFNIWKNSYAKNRGGDADGDGDTDGFDFLAWQREATFQTAPIASESTSVPEPSSLLLVCAGAFFLAFSSRAVSRCPPSAS